MNKDKKLILTLIILAIIFIIISYFIMNSIFNSSSSTSFYGLYIPTPAPPTLK